MSNTNFKYLGGMMSGNRRLWLIDAGYLFNSQKSVEHGYRFDYRKLKNKLEEGGEVWRSYYFNSTPNPPKDAQDGFHKWLSSAEPHGPKIITKLYGLKEQRADEAYCGECERKVSLNCPVDEGHRVSKKVQKGVDVGICATALIHKDAFDTLILSSGDGDLLDMVEHLSEVGKRIELLVFSDGVSTDLQARADKIHWINDFSEEVRQ